MAYAHQGIPFKPIVGLQPAGAPAASAVVNPVDLGGPQRPATLTKGAIQALEAIEKKARALGAGADKQTMLAPAASGPAN